MSSQSSPRSSSLSAALLLGAALLAYGVWARVHHGNPWVAKSEKETPWSDSAIDPVGTKRNEKTSRALPEVKPENVPEAQAEIKQIEAWLDGVDLDERARQLRGAFGTSGQAKELERMMVLSNLGDTLSPEEFEAMGNRLQAAYADDFTANPKASFDALESGLQTLNNDQFPSERASLIGTLNTLPDGAAITRRYSLQEMSNVQIPVAETLDQKLSTADPHLQSAAVVDQYFLDSCDDAEEAIRGTRAAMAQTENETLRKIYHSQLVTKFPEAANQSVQ